MIGDFLQFLEYYGTVSGVPALPYNDPLIRIEYDAINKDGELVLALMAPFAHAINALCYRELDAESYYNQKNIAQICRVSSSEVTGWKKEERFQRNIVGSCCWLTFRKMPGICMDINFCTQIHSMKQRKYATFT